VRREYEVAAANAMAVGPYGERRVFDLVYFFDLCNFTVSEDMTPVARNRREQCLQILARMKLGLTRERTAGRDIGPVRSRNSARKPSSRASSASLRN